MKLTGENQLHGKFFEECVINTYIDGNYQGKNLDAFDINACESTGNIPVSIKMTKTETVGLADARRAFSLEQDFKMIVAVYKQDRDFKVIWQVYEFNIKASEWACLKGNLDFDIVDNFHKEISSFSEGDHVAARVYAKNRKKEIASQFSSMIKLNPKIDSKKQRRLQCSIDITTLTIMVKDWVPYSQYNFGEYRGIKLPMVIFSKKRKFNSED